MKTSQVLVLQENISWTNQSLSPKNWDGKQEQAAVGTTAGRIDKRDAARNYQSHEISSHTQRKKNLSKQAEKRAT